MSPRAENAARVYRGEPLEARRQDQRDRLIAAGRDVFAERGYAGASVEDIVARARVSRTSFYRFFDNKEECLLAVFWTGTERLLAALASVAASDHGPVTRTRRGARALVEAFVADPAMARIVLIEVVGATRDAEEARARARAEFAKLLGDQMRATGYWAGESDREIELVSMATMAAVAESVAHLVATDRLAEWEEIVEPLERLVLRALTPGDPTEAAWAT